MTNRFIVEVNHCSCHPETCCCKDWKVTDTSGRLKKLTAFDQEEAKDLARILNNIDKRGSPISE